MATSGWPGRRESRSFPARRASVDLVRVRRRWLTAVSLLAAIAACTPADEPRPPEPGRGSSTAAAPSPIEPATPPAQFSQPLAFAYDIHRPPLDLTTAQAKAIAAGAPTTWAQLGQRGGNVHVSRGAAGVTAAETDPQALVVVPATALQPTVQVARVDGVDPLRDPSRYALSTESTAELPRVTTVTVVGDLMFGRGVAAKTSAAATLAPLRERLASADLTVGNLESTLSDDGRPRQGNDSFAADPAALSALERAGFDVLSLANNHTGDFGPRAFRATLRSLDASPIHRVGAGLDVNEAWRPVVIDTNGLRVGFVAFNAIGETPRATADRPGVAEVRMRPRTGPLDAGDLRRLTSTIADLARQVDIVVALPHWGTQYTNVPVRDQRRVATAMVDAGADVVIGGHPHVVQGIQLRRQQVVMHSLGNFVFDMDFSRQTEEGVLAELVFWGSDLRGLRLTPYVIGADFAPRLADGARARRTLARLWDASDPPFHR
jgi:poly-gamma-glutamate capsule biosynthesis protein CapA/YwtB (metallophosphatase superfamily)